MITEAQWAHTEAQAADLQRDGWTPQGCASVHHNFFALLHTRETKVPSDPILWSFLRKPNGDVVVSFDDKRHVITGMAAAVLRQELRGITQRVQGARE